MRAPMWIRSGERSPVKPALGRIRRLRVRVRLLRPHLYCFNLGFPPPGRRFSTCCRTCRCRLLVDIDAELGAGQWNRQLVCTTSLGETLREMGMMPAYISSNVMMKVKFPTGLREWRDPRIRYEIFRDDIVDRGGVDTAFRDRGQGGLAVEKRL